MPVLSKQSVDKLLTCDRRLINIVSAAIKIMDFSVITGTRGELEQNIAYAAGKSKLKFPDGKHNKNPSLAVDLCPYRDGLQWEDKQAFILLAGLMLGTAHAMGINLRWGGDWNSDFNMNDNTFSDLGHFEIEE